jgi:hypothetical protein
MPDAPGYVWLLDPTLKCFGEVDPKQKTVRINFQMHFAMNEDPLDTFIHEHLHIKYPHMKEAAVDKLAGQIVDFLPPTIRTQLLLRYLRQLGDAEPRPRKKKRLKKGR